MRGARLGGYQPSWAVGEVAGAATTGVRPGAVVGEPFVYPLPRGGPGGQHALAGEREARGSRLLPEARGGGYAEFGISLRRAAPARAPDEKAIAKWGYAAAASGGSFA